VSLYCFGKVVPVEEYSVNFEFPHGVTIDNGIDPEDRKDFDEFKLLAGDGIFFRVLDGPGDHEATGLWNEAFVQTRGMVFSTPLGAFVRALMFDRRIKTAGLAFVDGGIETIVEGSAGLCWQGFLDRIGKPWDNMDNPLFIWRNQ